MVDYYLFLGRVLWDGLDFRAKWCLLVMIGLLLKWMRMEDNNSMWSSQGVFFDLCEFSVEEVLK